MSSNRDSPRNPSTPQSIPLQDLSRPPDCARSYGSDEEWGRFRGTVSGRARALLGNRQSPQARRARYERVLERDVTEENQDAGRETLDVPHIQSPRRAHSEQTFYEDGELSPVDIDIGGFQAAMGSVGLSLNDMPGPSIQPPLLTRTSTSGKTKLGIIAESVAAESPESPESPPNHPDDDDDFNKPYDDQSPLTDNRYLQPISGSQVSTPSGKSIENRHRHSRQSSRTSPGSRLGADLGYTDASPNLRVPPGHRSANRLSIYSTRSISRSLSTTASPLTTAGSMLRKMSQRVVNLSNEPEVIEVVRQPSSRHARMDAPPSFPAMTEYAHEEAGPPSPPPPEKETPQVAAEEAREEWQPHLNPLKGKSLGIFGPNSRVRLALCEVLVHPLTEPFILVLIVIQTIFLAVEAATAIRYYGRSSAWGSHWTDRFFVALFFVYTLEILAHVIVSGLLRNAEEYSSLPRGITQRKALWALARRFFAPHDSDGLSARRLQDADNPQVSILRSFTTLQPDQPGHSRQQQRIRLARRAFLRHSFNRLDFLAVCSYWVFLTLVEVNVEQDHHIWVFQMLSCLRILRLLNLTNGTSVILRSLKKAAPLLVNVAFLISFFMLLFAIIGSQAFKSSFRRTCVWFGDDIGAAMQGSLSPNSYAQNLAPGNVQFCGGYRNYINGTAMSWVDKDLKHRVAGPKGFLCPERSMCVEGNNPYNGTVHFDDIFHSLELIFVIMSSNTFTDLLYYTTDSDYLLGAFFFAAAFVFMSLWLMNLLVAVITSSFQVIREETAVSAFTAEEPNFDTDEEEKPRKKSAIKRAFDKTFWMWITIITFDLVVQSLRTSDMTEQRANMISYVESAVTAILFLEILLRIGVDYRNFWGQKTSLADLAIAVITVIIQLPGIRSHGQTYAWLTFFQIIRIYRVVLAVPITRNLITVVLKNVTGLLNLIVFVFLMTFLCSIFAIQLFRGEFPPYDVSSNIVRITFNDIYNSFIGMYQILSSENWTTSMYNATQYSQKWGQGWIGAIFFILWFILANFIILNMFIAVIQESFDVSEDQKRLQQVKAFLQQRELTGSTQGTLSLATILKFGRDQHRYRDPLDYGPATMEMIKDAVVRDFLDEQMEGMEPEDTADDAIPQHDGPGGRPQRRVRMGFLSSVWFKFTGHALYHEPNPFYTPLKLSKNDDELDPRTLAFEYVSATESRKRLQRQYLQKYPHYNMSLFLFKPHDPVRKLCQQMVGPGRGGQRVEGVDPVKLVWYTFSFFIYANVLAMVLIACVTTPLYQRGYFLQPDGPRILTWFFWTDASFAIVFTVEAFIKVIADGFFWTPNAYFRSSWGFIDGIVLVTLWVNVGTSLFHLQSISRAVGAFKALRALRLLNISDSARETFHSIVRGGWKVIQAAFVSLSLLIPFAIYGLNLFNGQFLGCNDISFGTNQSMNLSNCVGEWQSTPFNNEWPILAPRQVANPYYNFDDFGNSMFILFQIVSQEGWVDVMWSAMSAAGKGFQPEYFRSQGNSVFFIIFNLLGAVFVLTLFVSVFMRNITEQTGVAFLTAEQRSWLELRKLLRQISPSKRPSNKSAQQWKNFCYRIAVKKHGKWQRTVTGVLVLHLCLLVAEFYPDNEPWEKTRDFIFVAFTIFYIVNIIIRIIGKSWKRFRRSSWDLFSLLAIAGTIITTILDFSDRRDNTIYVQLHKLFLVSITLLLIPRNNQLDQLFKTAAASLGAISNLLATWLVLFLVFAIALTQTLGLTRFGSQGKPNLNFRNVPKALILLFRMSCGEGWNQIMEDFAQITSPLCVSGDTFYDSDCGSAAWARVLFIAWNIVSMYIFVSMFVSLIFESFSYVYQRSNGLSMVSRDEIRRFKEAWATFDPEGSGYISKDSFPRLLGELSGIFEMRIYDGDHTVGRILEDCRVDLPPRGGTDTPPPPHLAYGIDIVKLNKHLASINVPEVKRRRARLELFSQEVLVTADPERGISFTACLMILAHYKIILDKNSLRLEEFLRRRYRLQKVQEQVRLNVVIGFFDTLYWHKWLRRRREHRQSARMITVPQFAVPEIFIEGQDWNTPVVDTFPTSPTRTLHQQQGSNGGVSPLDWPKNKSPIRGLAALTTSIPASPHSIAFNNSFTTGRQRKESISNASSPARSEAGGSSATASFHASPIIGAQQPGRRPSETSDRGDPFSLQVDGPAGGSDHGSVSGERSPTSANMWATTSGSRHGRTVSTQSMVRRGSESITASGGGNLGGTLGMLDVGGGFDNSAWGESIRRSFTTRRRDRKGEGS